MKLGQGVGWAAIKMKMEKLLAGLPAWQLTCDLFSLAGYWPEVSFISSPCGLFIGPLCVLMTWQVAFPRASDSSEQGSHSFF